MPEAVEKQRVQFAGSSFFDPLPPFRKIPDVFLLRHILHDWSDKYAIKILRNLRDAAGRDTKLVVIDVIIGHACDVSNGTDKSSVNPYIRSPPKPLLRNWGAANLTIYTVNLGVSHLVIARFEIWSSQVIARCLHSSMRGSALRKVLKRYSMRLGGSFRKCTGTKTRV